MTTPKSSFVSNVERYAETRDISSKINAILTNLMLKYTSLMIDHLLIAGKDYKTDDDQKQKNLNFVDFRVSDLMRAKYECS